MKSRSSLKTTLKTFNKDTWLLLSLLFFVRAGFFMTLPYFSFYLYYKGYTPMQIGWVIAAGPLVASILNFYSGFLSDKFGHKRSMIIAFSVFSLSNLVIAQFDGFWLYLIFNVFLRIADATFNSSMQAYLSNNNQTNTQHFVFHIRFMIINAAGAIGPIAGALLSHSHTKILFDVSALLSLIATIILFFISKDPQKQKTNKPQIGLKDSITILLKDKKLFWITGGFFIYWVAYLQLDTTLAQILAKEFSQNAVYLFALMWVINTVIVVIAQLPIAHYTQHLPYQKILWISCTLLALGFFILSYHLSLITIIIGMLVITIGEILSSPLSGIFISEIAPPELKSTYYGAANLSTMGTGIAPLLGSACLTFLPHGLFFMLMGCLFFVMLFCLLHVKTKENKL